MRCKLVLIEWQDAHSLDEGWTSQEEMEKLAASEEFWVQSVGWIYKETDKYYLIVSNVVPKGHFIDAGYLNVMKIPKGWVRKVHRLK